MTDATECRADIFGGSESIEMVTPFILGIRIWLDLRNPAIFECLNSSLNTAITKYPTPNKKLASYIILKLTEPQA